MKRKVFEQRAEVIQQVSGVFVSIIEVSALFQVSELLLWGGRLFLHNYLFHVKRSAKVLNSYSPSQKIAIDSRTKACST
ncbi:MAG: hypothetical protein ABS85_09015 [Sphingobacteriales bacterium SCN 48-20]|nr:MAG: hypothetical protein ABS85_09015 [Sphingobacteriales bacterium SCN 48-20]